MTRRPIPARGAKVTEQRAIFAGLKPPQCRGMRYDTSLKRCQMRAGHTGVCDFRDPPTPQAQRPPETMAFIDKDTLGRGGIS